MVIRDVIQESILGGAVSADETPRAVAGECYHFPLYRAWARTYNEVLMEGGHEEESNENFPVGTTNRHYRLATIRGKGSIAFFIPIFMFR